MLLDKGIHGRIRTAIFYVIIFCLGLLCFLPLLNILAISFSSSTAVSANWVSFLPVDFTVAAYERILADNQFWRSFMISVTRVVLGLALNLVLVVPMAYAMTRTKQEFRARNFYMKLLIFAMLFSGGMIPSYILVRNLKLLDTIWALVLPGALPIFDVILLMNFFHGIPKSLEEAAIMDGASPFKVLTSIMIPCAKPCLATITLFSIVGHWNSFMDGLIYIRKVENYPIMTYIKSLRIDMQALAQSNASSNTLELAAKLSGENFNAAKIVVSVIPLLVIYPLLQRYLIKGIVVGSVKE